MNSSRALFLAALMFAPIFAENTNPPAGNGSQQADAGLLSQAYNCLATVVAFPVVTAPDFIAQNTFGRIANIEYLKGGNVAKVVGNKTFGRITVYAATAALVYYIYQMNKDTQQTEDTIFIEDESDVFNE
jgi:hypothetical protein